MLLALTLMASACGSSTSSGAKAVGSTASTAAAGAGRADVLSASGTPKAGGSIVYGVEGESDGWNPTSARWSAPALTEAQSVLDPLAAWGPNYDAEPYLAKAFTHSDDYKTWNIELRPGITFPDGEVLDASAVKHRPRRGGRLDAHRHPPWPRSPRPPRRSAHPGRPHEHPVVGVPDRADHPGRPT